MRVFLCRRLAVLSIATLESLFSAQAQQGLVHKAELVNAEIKLQSHNKHLVTYRDMRHERNVTNLADVNV